MKNSDIETTRRLLRASKTAYLATLNADGSPYCSLVNLALDATGHPVVLISRLAWHTRNIEADGRASLLVAALPESGDALTGSRVTIMGTFAGVEREAVRALYLEQHKAAQSYIDFGDFSFWRMTPQTIHAVAGFGRIETCAADEIFPFTD